MISSYLELIVDFPGAVSVGGLWLWLRTLLKRSFHINEGIHRRSVSLEGQELRGTPWMKFYDPDLFPLAWLLCPPPSPTATQQPVPPHILCQMWRCKNINRLHAHLITQIYQCLISIIRQKINRFYGCRLTYQFPWVSSSCLKLEGSLAGWWFVLLLSLSDIWQGRIILNCSIPAAS